MSSTQAVTIEVRSADISRISRTAFFSGVEGVVEPLLKKHAASTDADISSLREHIIGMVISQRLRGQLSLTSLSALFRFLEFLTQAKSAKKLDHIHVVTLGEAPKIRGFLFAGTSTPVFTGSPAPTTAAALKNLLSKIEGQVSVKALEDAATTAANNTATPAATPSKLVAAGDEMSPFAIVKTPTPIVTDGLKNDSVLDNAMGKKRQPLGADADDESPFAFVEKRARPRVVAKKKPVRAITPPKDKHARMNSTDLCMWGSELVNNPSFGPNEGNQPTPEVTVAPPKKNMSQDTLVSLSFGSDNPISDEVSDGDTVVDPEESQDPFVEILRNQPSVFCN
jgi:hypothetical protein